MSKNLFLLVSFILFFNCNRSQIINDKYNNSLSGLILSNPCLKSKLIAVFELNKEENKVFKVLISRRDRFVRVSIFEIINKEELNELPSSYFTYKKNTFLCYDGTEVMSNKRLDKDFLNKLKSNLDSNVINDTRVFQFDLNSQKKVELHIPAINPYDLIETTPKHLLNN